MKSDKMAKVAAVAKIVEQKSAQELGASLKNHQQESDRLDQLVQFKEEYEQTLEVKGGEGMHATQLQNYRLFMADLNEAISQQIKELQNSGETLETAQEQWVSKLQRKMAVEHLVEERRRELIKSRNKSEQAKSDEDSMTRSNNITDDP